MISALNLQLASHVLALGSDFDNNTSHVFELLKLQYAAMPTEILETESKKAIEYDKGLKEMYDLGLEFMSKPYDLNELSQLPDETLGKAYSKHMLDGDLKPDLYKPHLDLTPSVWLFDRATITHDIWHVVCGFDTSVEGEIGINSFYLGQRPDPAYAFINIAGILSAVSQNNPKNIDSITDAIARGYKMGKNASSLLSVKWEDIWDKPLLTVRKELNIISETI